MLTITLLVGVVATPVLGRLADGAGRGRVLMAALATVVAGSVVAATATGFGQLLAGRALQGVGYATVPLTISIARAHLGGEPLQRGLTMLSITVATGAGLGFAITALLAQELGFRSAFWFGALFGAAALVALIALLPRDEPGRPISIDRPGALLLGGGLTAVLLGVTRLDAWGWSSPRTLGLLGGGSAILVAWVAVESRVAHPLVDIRLARVPAVMGANVAALFMAMGMFGGMSLMSRLAQTPAGTGYGLGASLLTTGLLMAPLSVASVVSQPLARRLRRRVGIAAVLLGGACCVATTLAVLAARHDAAWEIALAMALLGLGVATTFAMLPALIVASVPAERTGSASALNQIMRSGGGAVGSAVAAAALSAHTAAGAVHPAASGYGIALALAAACCLLAGFVAYRLIPRDMA